MVRRVHALVRDIHWSWFFVISTLHRGACVQRCNYVAVYMYTASSAELPARQGMMHF
ncbi:hypothetical protein CBM2633_U10088 [Cupriavidus taiwanensis]|nr:hypothetical protein CBM2633_U10088 [Cupriavidus taiwanensis]